VLFESAFTAQSADTIRGLQQHRKRLLHGFIVDSVARGSRFGAGGFLTKYTNGVLSVISRHSYEFAKDLDPIAQRRTEISRSQRLRQFFVCCHADLPLHVDCSRPAVRQEQFT
jgi:hypothetical protein